MTPVDWLLITCTACGEMCFRKQLVRDFLFFKHECYSKTNTLWLTGVDTNKIQYFDGFVFSLKPHREISPINTKYINIKGKMCINTEEGVTGRQKKSNLLSVLLVSLLPADDEAGGVLALLIQVFYYRIIESS